MRENGVEVIGTFSESSKEPLFRHVSLIGLSQESIEGPGYVYDASYRPNSLYHVHLLILDKVINIELDQVFEGLLYRESLLQVEALDVQSQIIDVYDVEQFCQLSTG